MDKQIDWGLAINLIGVLAMILLACLTAWMTAKYRREDKHEETDTERTARETAASKLREDADKLIVEIPAGFKEVKDSIKETAASFEKKVEHVYQRFDECRRTEESRFVNLERRVVGHINDHATGKLA